MEPRIVPIKTALDLKILQMMVAACTGVDRSKLRVQAIDDLANWINQKANKEG